MIAGLDILAVSGWLLLASGKPSCVMQQAPHIVINPVTDPVRYEFNLTAEELGRMQSNTINPYAPDTDSTTGGLRHDQPKMEYSVSWAKVINPDKGTVCLGYQKVRVDIRLSPKIYIAKDKDFKDCRDIIIEHELKHVQVDRKIMNDFSSRLGAAIQAAVNEAGALGPYNTHQTEEIEQQMQNHIKSVISAQELWLKKQMAQQQSNVDSLEEYERISKICQSKQ